MKKTSGGWAASACLVAAWFSTACGGAVSSEPGGGAGSSTTEPARPVAPTPTPAPSGSATTPGAPVAAPVPSPLGPLGGCSMRLEGDSGVSAQSSYASGQAFREGDRVGLQCWFDQAGKTYALDVSVGGVASSGVFASSMQDLDIYATSDGSGGTLYGQKPTDACTFTFTRADAAVGGHVAGSFDCSLLSEDSGAVRASGAFDIVLVRPPS